MKTTPIIALLAGCWLCASGSARAAIIFDNLATTTQGFGSVSSTTWGAQRFNSDSTNLLLTSVTLTLYSETGGSGTFFLNLFSDAVGQPGALLAALAGASDPFPGAGTQSGNIQFGGLSQPLMPNTNYWLVLGLNSGPALDLRWGSTSIPTGSGSGFQLTNAQTLNSGAGWAVSSFGPHNAQITVVPEPNTAICLALGVAALVSARSRRFERPLKTQIA